MSVQTEIDRIIGAVESAHEKVIAKGGTSARPYLVGNLADAIDTIAVEDLDSEIATQKQLIADIQTALESKIGATPSEDLDSVLDAQEMKLNELLTVLDGKAAGGGGTIGTYTLQCDISDDIYVVAYVTVYRNGVTTIETIDNQNGTFTVENVVCGSSVFLLLDWTFNGGGEYAEFICSGMRLGVLQVEPTYPYETTVAVILSEAEPNSTASIVMYS